MMKAKGIIISVAVIVIIISSGTIIVMNLSSNTPVADETSELNQELFNAAKNGDIDQVQKLVEKGADVNTCIDGAELGGPILISVSDKAQIYTLRFLLKKSKDNNLTPEELTKGISALMIASSGGHLGVVKYLVDNGADVNAATTGETGGNTALMIASSGGHLDVVKYLVDKGANVNDVTAFQGTTALMFASAMGHLDIVRLLVEKGANMSAVTKVEETTALMFASHRGHLDVVMFLIENGADVNAVANFEGGTSLMIALKEGQLDIAKFLVENDADVNVVTNEENLKGITALIMASREGHLEIVKSLVDNGADVNAVATTLDEKAITALMLAALKGHLDIIKFLAENGADITITDHDGKTAQDFAIKRAKIKVSDYIETLLKYNPFTTKSYKSTFTYFAQAEDTTENNQQLHLVKGLVKKDVNGINDIGNYQQITKDSGTHLEITINIEFDENKILFSYGTEPRSEETNYQIPLNKQVFTEDTANTYAYLIFPKEWKLSKSFQVIEAIKNSDGSNHSIMACPTENSEFSSLLGNYNALLEGTFWSRENGKSQSEKAVDIINEEDEKGRIEQLQEKYKDYQIYKIPFYAPEGITQAYSNIGRSCTIYFDKSSLTDNGKIFIDIPRITFQQTASGVTGKASLEGLAYELDLAEVKGNYKPEHRFVETPTGLQKKIIDLGNDITMEFVYIPAGEFIMGSMSNKGRRPFEGRKLYEVRWINDERPQHQVKISKGFWMGVYEVTNGQYQQFVKESKYDGERESNANYLRHLEDSGSEARPDYPVIWISWNNAQAFCEWLSVKEGKTYRLPTEAQWEYACRAGRTKELEIKDDGLFLNTSGGRSASMRSTHPVGQNQPNSYGLYDMYDNVCEWCRDWYGSYSDKTEIDPEGPSSGDRRVVRGDYSGNIISYRYTERSSRLPGEPSREIGFRVVCEESQ